MDKEIVIYVMEYYLAIKKNEILPFVTTRMHLEINAKWNKSDKDKIMYDLSYMWNLKRKKLIDNRLVVARGRE